MPSRRSRRAVLASGALAMVTVTAGCIVSTDSSDGGPGSDGSGANPGNDSGTNSGSTRTFGVKVNNGVSNRDLRKTEHASSGTPIEIAVEVSKSVSGQDDPVLFGKTLEIPPETTRSFENAFTTEPDQSYQASAELTPFHDSEGNRLPRNYRDSTRFRPGQYNTPDNGVLTVTVDADDDDEMFTPFVYVG